MAHDVFISHSVKDKAVADAVVARLEAESVTCWVAPRDVVPGADWGESIINAIESSRIMILIFSKSANVSPQIKREVERAVNKGVYIIPFRVDDIPPAKSLEYFISTSQWMDAFSPPLERHLDNLAKTVKSVIKSSPLTGANVPAQPERPPIPKPPTPPPSWRKSIPIAVAIAVLMIVACVGWYLVQKREVPSEKPAVTPTAPPTPVPMSTVTSVPTPAPTLTTPPPPPTPVPTVNIAMGQTIDVENLTSAEYQKKFNELIQAGFRPIKVWSKPQHVIDYAEGEKPSFGYWATFQKVPNGAPWEARHGLDAATYQQEFNKWTRAGYMPTHINVACVGSEVRYCVVYDKIANPPAWVARHNMDEAAFKNENATWTAKGYKVKVRSSCQSRAGWVYAAIWQK
jgi:hypothetical protein